MTQASKGPVDPRTGRPLDQRELDRLVAMGHRRDEAIALMSETIRKQEEARQSVIRNLG